MKSAKISIVFLIFLATVIIANSLYISNVTKGFANKLDLIDTKDTEQCAIEYKKLFSEFQKAEKFISITVSHDDLTNIEESFSDIIGAAEAGMEGYVIMIKSRLKDSLEHLGRLSGISLESII